MKDFVYPTILVLYSLALVACGNAVSSTKKPKAAATEDTTFLVTQIDPASGSQATVPTTVTVSFTEVPNRETLDVVTYYSMHCGSEIVHAADVDALTGYTSVVLTFDPIVVSSGTQCVFSVASNIQSESGQKLGGTRTANYSIP